MPGAKQMLEQQVTELDRQIARRMLRRPDTPSEKMPRLDMEIDLRIVARWFFAQAAAQKDANDAQAAARLRGQLALEAIAGVEDLLNKQREKLTLGQVDGMSKLHNLTFKLAEPKGPPLDEVSRQLASLAVMIAGPGAALPDARSLPLMRPRVPQAGRTPEQPGEVVNIPSIADRVPGLNVSVPLRQQLTLLVSAALSDKEKDHATIAKTLGTAFELAAALQNNVAVQPEARVQMESQLAEGIALFLDRRTRDAGRSRIADLSEYRRIVDRIGRLKLSADDSAKFAPIFSWAQREAEGMRALSALERFVGARERAGARAALPPSSIQALRKTIEDLEKQYAAAQAGFSSAFEELIKTTGGTGGAALETRANEMTQALDTLEKLDQAPATLDALSALKPKPFGGLERRIVSAAVAINTKSPEAAEGVKLLNDLHGLARLVTDLGALPTADVSGPVDTKYAGGRVAALGERWRALAGEIASSVASGGEVDAAKVARLALARSVYDALHQAAGVEASIAAANTLHRWIDWRISSDDLALIFQPYQDTLSAAVGAYIADAPKALDEWTRVEKRYRPLVSIITRARGFQRDVIALPEGLTGTAASLLTPCDNAPFAMERYLSFAAATCRARLAAGDEGGASEVLDLLLKRVNNE